MMDEPNNVQSMPFSDEAERGFLSCLFFDHRKIDEAVNLVPPEWMYQRATNLIYRAILRLYETGVTPEAANVTALLREGNNLEIVGGPGAVSEVVTFIPAVSHFTWYARLIRRDWFRRCLIERCNVAIQSARGFGDAELEGDSPEVGDLLAQAEESIFGLLQQHIDVDTADSGPIKADVFMDPYLDHVERVMANVGRILGMTTGFPDLDRTLCGLDDQRGELFTIAARPGHGKTAFLGTLIKLMAIDMQIPTLVFSMEMSRDQLMDRIAFGGFGIATNKARTGMLSQADKSTFATGVVKIKDSPLWIDETSDLTTAEFRARVDLYVRQHGIKLVFIDYLQLMEPVTKKGKDEERLGIKEVCKTVHALKKKHKLIFIAAAQLNQNIEKSPGRRHVLSDIEGSDAIGKFSDFVGFIVRPAELRRWEQLDAKRQEKQIRQWMQARRDQPDAWNGWRSKDIPHPQQQARGHPADESEEDDGIPLFGDERRSKAKPKLTSHQLARTLENGEQGEDGEGINGTTAINMSDGTTWTFDNVADWDQTAEIQLVKNRNGPTPDLPVRFNRALARFESRTGKVYSNNPAERQHST